MKLRLQRRAAIAAKALRAVTRDCGNNAGGPAHFADAVVHGVSDVHPSSGSEDAMGVIQLRGAGGATIATEALDSGASEALFAAIATLAGNPLALILADVEVARGIEARAEGFNKPALQWSAGELLDSGAWLVAPSRNRPSAPQPSCARSIAWRPSASFSSWPQQ